MTKTAPSVSVNPYQMKIDILCSSFDHPVRPSLDSWARVKAQEHEVNVFSSSKELRGGHILFLISCHEIIRAELRNLYVSSLVIHASDLPHGKGWSPHIWQILEGKRQITVTLFDAVDQLDAGDIWRKINVEIEPHFLAHEINNAIFGAELQLMDYAVSNFGRVVKTTQPMNQSIPHFRRRTPSDSRIDPDKSLASQFNLIRVSDPNRYPAYFELHGFKYLMKLEKLPIDCSAPDLCDKEKTANLANAPESGILNIRHDEAYYTMALIRKFEERVLELFSRGELFGTTHTSIGQEAIAVAAISELRPEDIIISNHRCHGHYLARTHDVRGLMAEMMGKESGICGGRGGSQHLCADNFFTNGIQGNMSPVAVGMAQAEKIKGTGAIILLFVGDGTFGEGALYEALNMASLWAVPLLIVVEHNGVAQTTPTSIALAGSFTGRAAAFGIQSSEVESNDVDVLAGSFRRAVDYVRKESRPFVQIIRTYRLSAHSKGDDHRDPEEIEAWRQRDPLKLLGAKLSESEVNALSERAARAVLDAEEFARNSGFSSSLV